MTQFKVFKTEAEAKKYVKEHGGYLTTRIPTPTGRKPKTYRDYMFAVNLGGLDEKTYPYCVQWNC